MGEKSGHYSIICLVDEESHNFPYLISPEIKGYNREAELVRT